MKWTNIILVGAILCCFWARGDSLDSVYNQILQEEAARKQQEKMETERPRLLAEAFERDIDRYLKIRLSSSHSDEDKMKLWVALCQRWGIFPIPEKPGFLAWNTKTCRAELAYRVQISSYEYLRTGDSLTVDGSCPVPKMQSIDGWWTVFVPSGRHDIFWKEYWSGTKQGKNYYTGLVEYKTVSGCDKQEFSVVVKPDCVMRRVWEVTQKAGLFRSEKGIWDTKYYKETL